MYATDTGLVTEGSTSFSENTGRKLENLIYLHLRRMYTDLYYFREKGECDFVVMNKGQIQRVVQLCYQIDDLNFGREYSGLLEAMTFFKLTQGVIVTFNQEDIFEEDGVTISLIPAHNI